MILAVRQVACTSDLLTVCVLCATVRFISFDENHYRRDMARPATKQPTPFNSISDNPLNGVKNSFHVLSKWVNLYSIKRVGQYSIMRVGVYSVIRVGVYSIKWV